MLTHVLHPFSCNFFSAFSLSAYGADPGSILSLYSSSREISVMPYSLSLEHFARLIGRIPLVRTVHFIPASFSFFITSRLIFSISEYPTMKGSVVKPVSYTHLSRIRRCMTRSSAGSTSRSDGQCVHNSCFKRFTIDISRDIATLCILQFFYNFLYCIGIEVRQIQVYIIQSLINLNMHLHRCTDHSSQKLCNIGCIRRMTEGHHRLCSWTIPSG